MITLIAMKKRAKLIRFLLFAFVLMPVVANAGARNPLLPVDTSSPRATMQSFLALTEDATARYRAYRDAPSRATQQALLQVAFKAERLFDLREVAPASRLQVADRTFYLLWEVIARQRLPKLADIPAAPEQDEPPSRWRLSGTEITIARVTEGPYSGEYQFSPTTVAQVSDFYDRVRDLPYRQPMAIKDAARIDELFTGWLIPVEWVESLPDWANASVGGLVFWKWVAVALLIGLEFLIVIATYRWGRRKEFDGSFRSFLRYVSAPIVFLLLIPVTDYFAYQQIHVTGPVGGTLQAISFLSYGFTSVWLVWLTTNQVAEAIIASPRVASKSLDASLLRLASRTIGVVAILILIFQIMNKLGVPVAGMITGAGVGGVALALAAKSTLENFMGALNLFADRPVRVGDLCRYDEDSTPGWRPVGRVESVGLRSTQIRRIDRTLITIPNAEFAQRNIVNLSAADRFLLSTELGLRYETTDDQMRFLLAALRELLHAHPETIHTVDDPIRVRFVGVRRLFAERGAFAPTSKQDTTMNFSPFRRTSCCVSCRLSKMQGPVSRFLPARFTSVVMAASMWKNRRRQRNRSVNGALRRRCRSRISPKITGARLPTPSTILPKGHLAPMTAERKIPFCTRCRVLITFRRRQIGTPVEGDRRLGSA